MRGGLTCLPLNFIDTNLPGQSNKKTKKRLSEELSEASPNVYNASVQTEEDNNANAWNNKLFLEVIQGMYLDIYLHRGERGGYI